ncbi:MAG: aminotransferase class V-fold PLP-dependent enzyme [Sphingomonadaceae bacterium]|nr:aminotransferase class V-fold PLP-dependent enzyme [Sphingomonadaceae bacterium]
MRADILYLDHAATTPLLPAARDAMNAGFAIWANPSSPHKSGRVARAALEEARAQIAAALGWNGEIIFTSGASEALSLAVSHCSKPLVAVSAVEHDAVLRRAVGVARLDVDQCGLVDPALARLDGLVAVQQVNSETGVIQPLDAIAKVVRESGGCLLADCSQGAGKIDLPDADFLAVAAHKFGGPIGVGALLVRDWALMRPGGGQERGYRGGTENLPAVLGMAAALEEGNGWLEQVLPLRAMLDSGIEAAGGEVIAASAERIATIGCYRMPGVASAVQLIRFDGMGIEVSAGSACSSGSLKSSRVLSAMRLDDAAASEVIRVSIGRETSEADIGRFVSAWTGIAQGRVAS